jgi:hypothetical protein
MRCFFATLLLALTTTAAATAAGPQVIDRGDDVGAWEVIAADGVTARLVEAQGAEGNALRFEYDFTRGSGFCVIRRRVDLELPANYRFRFRLRGEGPPNNLEFKLVDPSGENVWWVNKRATTLPADWQQVTYRARQFQFAWGPSGGKPLERLGAIEFAIAAAEGGRGALEIDELTFEPLPPVQPPSGPPSIAYSSTRAETVAPAELPAGGELDWHSAANDPRPELTVDFGQVRELGGIILGWDSQHFPPDYVAELSADGDAWEQAASIAHGNGGLDYVALPEAEARLLRVRATSVPDGEGIRLRTLRIAPPAFGESINELLRQVAADHPRGSYPRWALGEQTAWTIVGVENSRTEALLSADGALEVDKLAFTIEPFIFAGDKLITWADAEIGHALADGYLPIPAVTWRAGELELVVTALADGTGPTEAAYVHYALRNIGEKPIAGSLFLALRPLQVLPPWQSLNITGGFSPIRSLEISSTTATVNDARKVHVQPPASAFGATTLVGGDISEHLRTGRLPQNPAAKDADGLASGSWAFPFELGPGDSQSWLAIVPHDSAFPPPQQSMSELWGTRLARVAGHWREKLNRAQLHLPPSAQKLVDTFRSTQAYILINRDGPSIQPGSRTYERSWIRDGALTSTALLVTGHLQEAREFLDWYAPYQYESGKIPCVVDRRGPDPVNEHDSTGEYLHALYTLYRYNQDRAMLAAHLPRVRAAVDYIAALRAQRTTPEYESESKRAYFGLVPESISHEGYSAKPMHSYWDNFFIQRGLRVAVRIAEEIGEAELAKRFAAERDAHAAALRDSLRLAMRERGIDYLPGCVELGDFDATSTAVALFPCMVADLLDENALHRTFDKYYEFFLARRDGRLEWRDYTPYEVRVIGTFVHLGQRERAHELADFFFRDQRPAGWNQWAEVVHRDTKHPGFIGDMPHTWVGSDFVNAVRTMFVYEHADGQSLVLGAGVTAAWAKNPTGVSLSNFPTEFGPVSYRMVEDSDGLRLELTGQAAPPGGFVLAVDSLGPFRRIRVDGREQDLPGGAPIRVPAGAREMLLARADPMPRTFQPD